MAAPDPAHLAAIDESPAVVANAGMELIYPGPAVSGVFVTTSPNLRLAVAAYPARFKGQSRVHTESDLKGYLSCQDLEFVSRPSPPMPSSSGPTRCPTAEPGRRPLHQGRASSARRSRGPARKWTTKPDAGHPAAVLGRRVHRALRCPGLEDGSSWYLVATNDHAIPPKTQRFMAARAGSVVSQVKASHVPMQSRPRGNVRPPSRPPSSGRLNHAPHGPHRGRGTRRHTAGSTARAPPDPSTQTSAAGPMNGYEKRPNQAVPRSDVRTHRLAGPLLDLTCHLVDESRLATLTRTQEIRCPSRSSLPSALPSGFCRIGADRRR